MPREQILGREARAKVPDEFVVQHSRNANPPTLLLTLHRIVQVGTENTLNPGMIDESFVVQDMNGRLDDWDRDYLRRMWPRLVSWYGWFNTTQVGTYDSIY